MCGPIWVSLTNEGRVGIGFRQTTNMCGPIWVGPISKGDSWSQLFPTGEGLDVKQTWVDLHELAWHVRGREWVRKVHVSNVWVKEAVISNCHCPSFIAFNSLEISAWQSYILRVPWNRSIEIPSKCVQSRIDLDLFWWLVMSLFYYKCRQMK